MSSDTPSGLRVLLVDDDADGVRLLAEQLKRAGHTAEFATDPESALAAIERFRPDVAIIDLGLPVMNGYELARHVRTISDCKLVALSGFGRDSAPTDTAVTTFDRHLLKPVDTAALLQTLRAFA